MGSARMLRRSKLPNELERGIACTDTQLVMLKIDTSPPSKVNPNNLLCQNIHLTLLHIPSTNMTLNSRTLSEVR